MRFMIWNVPFRIVREIYIYIYMLRQVPLNSRIYFPIVHGIERTSGPSFQAGSFVSCSVNSLID